MPVPGKHENEPKVDLGESLYLAWLDARDQAMAWRKRQDELQKELNDQFGTSTMGLVNGRPALTYRYKEKYATAALIRDNPALTEYYMKDRVVRELDVEAFAKVHPEIAQKYQIRELRAISNVEVAGNGE